MNFKFPTYHYEAPATENEYYQWLLAQNKTDIHAIHTKREYLESIRGVDRLTESQIEELKLIESMYFNNECK